MIMVRQAQTAATQETSGQSAKVYIETILSLLYALCIISLLTTKLTKEGERLHIMLITWTK